jgi:TorA maturation chaperone TorD
VVDAQKPPNCYSGGKKERIYVTISREQQLLLALRDFFMAGHAAEMAAAYEWLALVADEPPPYVEDWQQVAFAFNRLFVGPKALLAPPYASVYLDPEPQLMGRTTLQLRELYSVLDLNSPWKNTIPDDHISFELDAYRQLLAALAVTPVQELESARSFLAAHMRRWLPSFTARIQQAGVTPPAIWFVSAQLLGWVVKTADGIDADQFAHRTGVFA